jgi:mRNA interferase RelE/StbE
LRQVNIALKPLLMSIRVVQASGFVRAYKRLHNNQKDAVDAAVAVIVSQPEAGQAKKGDLAGVFVYKFDCVNQVYLLAYEYDPQTRVLLLVGAHENFYRNLKR